MGWRIKNKGFKRTEKSKYNNKKVVYEGISFASSKECERYKFLKLMENQGIITELQIQQKFLLIPAVIETQVVQLKTKSKTIEKTIQRPIYYISDFTYKKDGVLVVEDVKASQSRYAIDKVFFIKEKIFRWKYGFAIKKVIKYNEEV